MDRRSVFTFTDIRELSKKLTAHPYIDGHEHFIEFRVTQQTNFLTYGDVTVTHHKEKWKIQKGFLSGRAMIPVDFHLSEWAFHAFFDDKTAVMEKVILWVIKTAEIMADPPSPWLQSHFPGWLSTQRAEITQERNELAKQVIDS